MKRAEQASTALRRRNNPATCGVAYTEDQLEFLRAMDSYKRSKRRPFPAWHEVLEVLKSLGYRKVAAHEEVKANHDP